MPYSSSLTDREWEIIEPPTVSKDRKALDTLGFPFFNHCTKASVSDDVGLIEMLSDNIDYFKSKPVNIPKITK